MHEVLIIGGGLSGLRVADRLLKEGRDVVLLEARARLGGRILSVPGLHAGAAHDAGPAWVWPELQPRITALLAEMGLDLFPQE